MRLSTASHTRMVARLALLALIFQLSALGHWSLVPIHAEPGSVASHAAHCHGDIAGCAGESSFSGSLAEVNLTPIAPSATPAFTSVMVPSDAHARALLQPPRV